MKTPEISVILPVFNGATFVRAAIDSVLGQTFTDFELIIINDGSTDDTELIIRSYTDNRIKYFRQQNTGIGPALVNGIKTATGRYLARMDADDICFPDRIEHQHRYLECNPSAVMVSSAVRYINESGKVIGRSFPYTSDRAIRKALQTFNPVCHPAVMMRTEAYQRSAGYLNIQPFEDHFLWLSLARLGKLHNLKYPLLYYRILDNSVSRSVPAIQSERLFRFLYEKFKQGMLDEGALLSYMELFHEEKRRRLQSIQIHAKKGKHFPITNHTSGSQTVLFQILKSVSIPENLIEHFICGLKNAWAATW
jgi:glycosyltransferase involved in cell wall biosynthesis